MSRAGSHKSKAENVIEDMEIEEIEAIIEEKNREVTIINREKGKIMRNKTMNQGAKDTKLKPFNDRIEELKAQLIVCYKIIEAKIPPYEKLPKDHMYYKHFMQKLDFNRMND